MTRGTLTLVAATSILIVASSLRSYAATITVIPVDPPNQGFNDPAPVTPIGLNAGTTAGAQRRIAVQEAADIWAAALESDVEIEVRASFQDQFCNETSAILATAGPETVHRDFFNAPIPLTWYPQALANKLAGFDLAPNDRDIGIRLNGAIDGACPLPVSWYYGLDANPGPGQIDVVSVALHEVAHGLGFLSLVDSQTGEFALGNADIYSLPMENHSACRRYPQMTEKQRASANRDTGDLHWTGLNVVFQGSGLTHGRSAEGHVEIYAPDPTDPGSSLSHFSNAVEPYQLMEPSYLGPNHDINLTLALLHDLGWNGELPASANPACNQGQFQVNTHTLGSQRIPAVAMSGDGTFMVTWYSEGINNIFLSDIEAQDGNLAGIYAQMYDPTGKPLGSEFRVNAETQGEQTRPSVAANAAGNFVVVWNGLDGYGSGVLAQRYDDQGTPVGTNFIVNSYTGGGEGFAPKVGVDASGGFVVAFKGDDGDGPGAFARRFDSNGNPIGTDFQVNTFTTDGQGDNGLDISVADDGSFVIVWKSDLQDSPQIGVGFEGGVYGQRYSALGDPVGPEFLVNTYTTNAQGFFGLAVDSDASGNFVVTWTSVQDDGHIGDPQRFPYGGIFGQRFDSSGNRLGSEFQINVGSKWLQYRNDVAVAPSGHFLATWQSLIKFSPGVFVTADVDIFARLFDSDGNSIGKEFRVNAFQPGDQRYASAAFGASGDMVIVFESVYCDGSDDRLCGKSPDGMAHGIFGQKLSSATPTCDAVPRSDCSTAGKSVFAMQSTGSKKLVWKWLKGAPLDSGDFGQPEWLTNYVLCFYQDGITPTLAMTADLPGGGTCGNKPCWKSLGGSKLKGFSYKNRDGTPDGLFKVLLKRGEEGRSKLLAKGRGANLPLPALPLASYDGSVVQLVTGDGRCWESRFSGPAKRNTSSKFVEK